MKNPATRKLQPTPYLDANDWMLIRSHPYFSILPSTGP
ncbi:hypothetical protein SBA7_330008 [Candidatus Sulfotelmatobacter sp. SbA7]|nr:hypothetical protein SBA7_330008 [Candidatus Sulfotelmatobacter sp. SbA7]